MASDNVVHLDTLTSLDVPADRILANAAAADLEGCVVLGWTKDGQEYFAASFADGADVVWLLERCKLLLLRGADNARPVEKRDGEVVLFPKPED